MALTHRIVVPVLTACIAVSVSSAQAQIPDTFTNLKVFPRDIKKQELVGAMRSFSMALGVRCDHCHMEDEVTHENDWASDAKDAKKIAREMMKMSGEVNSILAKSIGSMRPDPLQVRCVTCHHGLVKPETLEQVLTASLNLAGTDSTLAKYERLRGKYYGAAAYDFSEWSLISIAENIAKDPGKADAALALLATNLTYYPESAGTYARIAETYLVKGDRETAIANFDKALALAPEDPWLKRRVEKVKAGN
ncbi:MAG: c-type cytochrome [Candidatus Krumholzibacteria bacterium]|nr:c-type cytochrome [Candidatus Krumholzibacteria bacterium]MDH4337792.1 c-type cytochrome [Candidatus Krumholzibacteria bacterium]MDH5270846.1 c-type cytochrome [Candidatus Krumholzibacteria bacterium]MDH5627160.1 c-type cytochrome [Candidatus Krumholzibacteria bacterium]